MATADEHRAKWLHNRDFVAAIDDRFADWIVTAMFYAALHAAEMLFAHEKLRVHGGHGPRNETLKTTHRYKPVWKEYYALYDASRTARYEVGAEIWVCPEDARKYLAPHLYRLEKRVLTMMKAKGDPPGPIW